MDERLKNAQQFVASESFTDIKTLKDLPPGVKKAFIDGMHEPSFMADVNEPFSAGCERMPNEAGCRLIFGAKSNRHCLLFFESGGFALQRLIGVFDLANGNSKLQYVCRPLSDPGRIENFAQLKKLFLDGKVDIAFEISK